MRLDRSCPSLPSGGIEIFFCWSCDYGNIALGHPSLRENAPQGPLGRMGGSWSSQGTHSSLFPPHAWLLMVEQWEWLAHLLAQLVECCVLCLEWWLVWLV